jgi:hypothetical protein
MTERLLFWPCALIIAALSALSWAVLLTPVYLWGVL